MKVSFWFTINLVIVLVCFCESTLTPEVKKFYSGFLSGKGLYNDDDGVVILNATNFKTKIYGSSNAWLVKFYNSWCGHCHKFAVVWKSLAANLYEWRKVLQLAALDCAVDENTSICRNYDILAYPTVKFFSAYSPPSSLGTELVKTSNSENDITRDVIGILQKEQLEGRGIHWPNIIPYRNYDTTDLWKHSDSLQYIFLIFANENDPLATEVTLDLSNVKGVEIRGVVADNEILSKLLGVQSYPSLLVLEKSKEKPEFLRPEAASRESFRLTIKSFLKSKGFEVPDEPRKVAKLSPNEMPSLMELQNAKDTLLHLQKIKELGDVVFLVDLENTVRYSLEHEISARKIISGEAFRALNNYLRVLTKYFPMSESGVIFFRNLRNTVSGEKEMKGLKFRTYLSNISNVGLESALSTNKEWIGCKGSESHFRGYPCGMWTLFHYLTINALQDSEQVHFDPLEVLEAMVGYITYFFGCTQCSKHFQQMVINRSMRSEVTDGEQAVLWLWSAHNEVNNRLAKDESEDPEFPKIQFPSSERCPSCRDDEGNWDKQNVLKYLKIVYGQDNLNLMGSASKLQFPNKSNLSDNDNLSKSDLFEDESPKKMGKDFNIFDISLCVVLYVVSAVICVGVCLKFILKKRHRRKSHGQDLLDQEGPNLFIGGRAEETRFEHNGEMPLLQY